MMNKKPRKATTTLTIERSLLKEAKRLGINVSGLTELALKGFTFKSTGADTETVQEAYDGLFKAMLPIIEKYDAGVKVAEMDSHGVDEEAENPEMENHDDWYLEPIGDGKYMYCPDNEFQGPVSFEELPPSALLPPDEILTNLLDALITAVKNNDEKVAQLQMAKRLVKAISVESEVDRFYKKMPVMRFPPKTDKAQAKPKE